MSSKRPHDVVPPEAAAGQHKKLRAGAPSFISVKRKGLKAPASDCAAGSECTFQSLGDDEICHILSFILCLPRPVKPPKMPDPACLYYVKSTPGKDWGFGPSGRCAAAAWKEFRKLQEEERRKYYRMAGDDMTIFNADMARYKNYLKQRVAVHPKKLSDACRTIKLVCKQLHRVVSKFTNHGARRDIIAPEDLAAIKARVGRLDLSSVCPSFLKLCDDMYLDRKFLPSDLYHQHGDDDDHCPLEYICRYYANSDYDAFAKLISVEFRKFLVVKAVELQAQKKKAGNENSASSSSPTRRTKSSMPGQLVHTFWQAYMMSPRKYAEDCMSIAGEIIDCNCSSYSEVDPTCVSRYYVRRNKFFEFECKLSKEYFHTGRQPALYTIENVIEVASTLREEEAIAAAAENENTDDTSGEDEGHTDNEEGPVDNEEGPVENDEINNNN